MTNIATPIVAILPDDEARAPSLGRLLKRAYRAWSKVLRGQLEPLALTPVQVAALRELYCCDGLSLGGIARRLKADPPTMSGVVDGLVNAGFVERREDPDDRRKLRLYLTDQARAIEGELQDAAEQCERALIAGFTPAEVELLKALLGRLCEAAESSSPSE
jgi:DNA-binding MarR family transcriptional regulator